MHPSSALALLLPSWTFHTAHAQESNAVASTELDVNFLTASFECSHHGKEWRICTQPDGWGCMFYCPAYSEYNETELAKPESGNFDVSTPLTPCFTCPGSDSNCSQVVAEVLTANNIGEDQNSTLWGVNLWEEALDYCAELCEKNEEGEACTQDSQCTAGALFCDYAADDTEYTNGICRACPTNSDECFEEGFATSVQGQHNCRNCRLDCTGAADSVLWIDGEIIPSHPIDSAIQASRQSASGPLYDCSELVLSEDAICEGAEGKMCLVEYKQQFALPWQVSRQAEKSGCVGVVAFIEGYDNPFSNSNGELLIPYVYIPIEDGKRFLSTKIGTIAKVQVDVFGAACYPSWESNMCSATWPCDKGDYCEFRSVPIVETDLFSEGNCVKCPSDADGNPDPVACYFDSRKVSLSGTFITVTTKTVQRVQECAATCGAELTSKGCKFCTSAVTAFEFGVESEETQCILCPEYDVQYPDRIVPLFGENVKCWQLESFFKRLPVPEDSRNCQLAQSLNYICGCQGTGYAGASTLTKQAVLAWMPRVAAILSILGSSFVIVDTQRTPQKRAKTINKILCTMSIFDILGSFSMAFTTLPTPSTDYIYGAKGNEATCVAQAFFIQMGTVACLIGVSLSLYYNLTIKGGWSEAKLKRKRIIYFLLVPPIVVGMIFAVVGIPYYDNVVVWCNNSASWWPEVPVILAIFYTTLIMGDMCLSVYKKESASSRYTGGKTKLSKVVFKQALFFVGAIYITWVPYLTLQYMWSSGKGYDIYGLTLAAATLVPLQGLWNFYVYARPRYFNTGDRLTVFRSLRSSANTFRARIERRKSSTGDAKDSSNAVPQTTQSGRNSETNKSLKTSGANNSAVAMESEIVQFGTPDPDELYDEPDVVPFGAPDPTEESKIDEDQVNEDVIKEGANEEVEDDDDVRFEMCLAG